VRTGSCRSPGAGTASLDGAVKIWDAESGDELLTLEHPGPVNDVAWSADGRRLATAGGSDVLLRIWDASPAYEKD
jgi:WD40 repeat protein